MAASTEAWIGAEQGALHVDQLAVQAATHCFIENQIAPPYLQPDGRPVTIMSFGFWMVIDRDVLEFKMQDTLHLHITARER